MNRSLFDRCLCWRGESNWTRVCVSARRRARMRETDFSALTLLCLPGELIGMGGMARVVKGVLKGAQGFEKVVAVKELLPPYEDVPSYQRYLIAESRILSQINHPNVVQVLGLTEKDGLVRIILEFIDGVNLREVIEVASQMRLRFTVEEISSLVLDILKGLAGIASQLRKDELGDFFLIHRDLCPENVIVDLGGHCKILDFGIAKVASQKDGSGWMMPSGLRGRYQYMSPEQRACQKIDSTSDIYSVGVIHQELIDRLSDVSDERLSRLSKILRARVMTEAAGRFKRVEDYLSVIEEICSVSFLAQNTLSDKLKQIKAVVKRHRVLSPTTPVLYAEPIHRFSGLRKKARDAIGIPWAAASLRVVIRVWAAGYLKTWRRDFRYAGYVAGILFCITINISSMPVLSRSIGFHVTTYPVAVVKLDGAPVQGESVRLSATSWHSLEVMPLHGKQWVRAGRSPPYGGQGPMRVEPTLSWRVHLAPDEENHLFLFFE